MKLKYRGANYEIHPTEVKILNKNNKVLFRRSSYNLNTAVINLKKKPKADFAYRSISNNNIEEKKFMGISYESKSIQLVSENIDL